MKHPRRLCGASVTAAVCLAVLGQGLSPVAAEQPTAPATSAAGHVLATIPVGLDAGPVAVDPALGLAYVVRHQAVPGKEFGNAVLVEIDLSTHRVVRRVVVGHDTVSGIAVDPSTHRIYVLLGGYNNGDSGPEGVQVIAGPGGRVIAHVNPGSGAVGMAIAPGLHRAWVATVRGGVGVVDLRSNQRTGSFGARLFPDAVTWDPVSKRLIVVSAAGNRRLATFYTAAGVGVGSVVVGRAQADPYEEDSVAVDPGVQAAYFGNSSSTAVWQVDTRTLRVVRKIAVGAPVSSLSVDTTAHRVYAALADGQDGPQPGMAVIDEGRGRIVARVRVEPDPGFTAVDAPAHLVIVSGPIDDRGDSAVQLITTQ